MKRPARRRIILFSLLAVSLAAICAFGWWYVSHMRSAGPGVHPDRSKYPVVGLDLSAHNGVVDFESVRSSGVDFVILKASEGATVRDRRFADNMARALKSGLRVGAYHFFRFDVPGHLQALNFQDAVRGRRLDFPLIIDVEEWGNPSGVPISDIGGRLIEMISYLEGSGYRVMIYTNKNGLEDYFRRLPRKYPLWICSFTDPPLDDDNAWILWQHTHRGHANGVDGAVDINTFNGTHTDFARWVDQYAVPGQ